MIAELDIVKMEYPICLGIVAIETGCAEITKRTGHYMNGYTLFVNSELVHLALKLMAVCPRIGVVLDDKMSKHAWKLVAITPNMHIVGVENEGA